MKNGRNNQACAPCARVIGFFRTSKAAGVLALSLVLTGRVLAAAQEWNAATLADAADALQKSDTPWPLMERLLEGAEPAPIYKYVGKLSAKQTDALLKTQSLLDLFAGRYPEALASINQVERPDPWTVEQRKYLEALVKASSDFVAASSDRFLLRTPPEDDFLAVYALKAMESAHGRMANVFKVTPSTRVIMEIYPTQERFSAASTLGPETLERSGAIGICKFRRLMVLSPRAMPLGYRWLDALAHEYNHYLINELSGGLCPLWLHEGVARYYETAWRRSGPFEHSPAAETALANASSGTAAGLIPFSRMEPSMVYLNNQEEVGLAFAEVSDCVGYVVDRFGPEKLAELLKAFRRYPREEAFQRALGVSEAELESGWKQSLAERKWNVSKGAMAQTISLRPMDEMMFVGVDVQGHLRLGDQLRSQKQNQAALIQYKKALDQEPDNGVVLLKAARTALALEQNAKAEAWLRRAVEKNTSYVTPYVALGELLYEDGRFEEGQRFLQEALEINPYHPRVHELLGMIALDVGYFPAARRSLELSLKLDPGNTRVMEALRGMPKDGR